MRPTPPVPDAGGPTDAGGHEVVDGGDRSCGELLLVLAARARRLPHRTPLRLLASDPAAAVDLPAWCHLTGHEFLGPGSTDGRRHYDLRTRADARGTRESDPWRLADGEHRATGRSPAASEDREASP